MAEQYWAACQTMPGNEHVIRAEIEKLNRGAFLPTLARTWVSNGMVNVQERPAVPGYVFFRTALDEWGDVGMIEGVQRVLAHGVTARRVSNDDMVRLVLGHATGAHDRIEARIITPRKRGSSRKPRPGKRIRARKNTVR